MAVVPTIVSSLDEIAPTSVVLESSRNVGPPDIFDAEQLSLAPKPLHPKTETNNTILTVQILLLIIPILLSKHHSKHHFSVPRHHLA